MLSPLANRIERYMDLLSERHDPFGVERRKTGDELHASEIHDLTREQRLSIQSDEVVGR